MPDNGVGGVRAAPHAPDAGVQLELLKSSEAGYFDTERKGLIFGNAR